MTKSSLRSESRAMFIATGLAAMIAFSRASEALSAASVSFCSVMSTANVPTAPTRPSASSTGKRIAIAQRGSPWV